MLEDLKTQSVGIKPVGQLIGDVRTTLLAHVAPPTSLAPPASGVTQTVLAPPAKWKFARVASLQAWAAGWGL